jgi:hypothetical protein
MFYVFAGKPKALDKIADFKNLQVGWHYGGGRPPNPTIVNKAKRIIEHSAMLAVESDAFPGVEGELMVAVYSNEKYLEFTVEVDGLITFVMEVEGEETEYKEGLSLYEAIKKLVTYCGRSWNTSESCTTSTMTPNEENLRVWHSEILPVAEFQSSLRNALKKKLATYVSTLGDTIQIRPVTPKSSGHSHFKIFQENVALNNTQAIPETFATAT